MKSLDCTQIVSDLHSANEMLARFTDEINSATYKSNFVPIRALEQKLEESLDSLESRLTISLSEACELMKGKFIGPEDIQKAFGFTPENIPEIPFDIETLELHERLGHYLIYEATKTKEDKPLTFIEMARLAGSNVLKKDADGNPTAYRLFKHQFNDDGTIKSDAWFAEEKYASIRSETPDGGWKFVSIDIIPDSSKDLDYIGQTDLLITYLTTNIFTDSDQMPENYQDAINEWKDEKPKIQKLIKARKYIEVSSQLSKLQITNLLRESFASTVYRLIILQKTKNIKILPNMYTWSKTPSSVGDLLNFGAFDSSGADLRRGYSDRVWDSIGSVFSRMN